ncbi:MAG: efflux RND transporter periplasmic adaptor subunit [Pseudomonadota bacterium]
MKTCAMMRAIGALFLLSPLAACGGGAVTEEAGDEHGAAPEAETGAHGGRLLKDGDFAVEMTIVEDGQAPRFRVYPTRDGKPVEPSGITLSVTLRRLGGRVDRFAFKPAGDHLAGEGVVEEPHSFDVEVIADEGDRRHRWAYASPEGRTRIAAAAAKAGGVVIERVGPAMIGETRDLVGTVQLATTARSEVRAQFPGRVVQVYRAVGDIVRRGDLLARIESSESLQVYPVRAPASGVVAERNANVGNVAFDQPIFVITDPGQTTVVFDIFPRDLTAIQPGQRVTIETLDGQVVGDTRLGGYLPEGNAEAGTALMRASLSNPGNRWRPGMALRGRVVVNAVQVPLAVRTAALQRFRNFTVVFANYGEDYEVRMLSLGRTSPEWTEVTGGLAPGTPYAARGSFLIRADIEKSGASHDH